MHFFFLLFFALFPASSFSRNFGPAVGGHFFFFLHPTCKMLLSLFQITCQNFRSKLQKLGVILRYCRGQGLLPGPARRYYIPPKLYDITMVDAALPREVLPVVSVHIIY